MMGLSIDFYKEYLQVDISNTMNIYKYISTNIRNIFEYITINIRIFTSL